MAREDARPSWASKPLRSPAERRRARKWAATSAENAIWRLTAQLKEAKAAALAASDPQVRARLDASVPALAKLCHGMPVRGAERLRRNVAWHSAELPSPSAPLSAWRAAQRGPRLEHREMFCSDLDAGDDGGPRPQLSEVSCSGAPHSLSLDAMPYLPLALRPADAAHLFVLKTVLTDILAPLAGACALVPDAEAQQCALVQRLAEALEVSRRLPADCNDPSAHLAADVGAECVPTSEDGLLAVQPGLFCSPASAELTDEDGQLSEQDSVFVQPADEDGQVLVQIPEQTACVDLPLADVPVARVWKVEDIHAPHNCLVAWHSLLLRRRLVLSFVSLVGEPPPVAVPGQLDTATGDDDPVTPRATTMTVHPDLTPDKVQVAADPVDVLLSPRSATAAADCPSVPPVLVPQQCTDQYVPPLPPGSSVPARVAEIEAKQRLAVLSGLVRQ